MDKLHMQTPDIAEENFEKLRALFPNAVTEAIDPETGEESQVLTTGVFVLVGQQAEFKPVAVVEQMEDFALVAPADGVSAAKTLRAGDQIILSSVELTDGAVILDS